MQNLSSFTGAVARPRGLLNGASALVGYPTQQNVALLQVNCASFLTPACNAGVLLTVMNLRGPGVLSFLACCSANTTLRSHSLKVTLDGVVIFSATCDPVASPVYYFPVLGGLSLTAQNVANSTVVTEPIFYNESLVVEYASSLSETAGAFIGYKYFPR